MRIARKNAVPIIEVNAYMLRLVKEDTNVDKTLSFVSSSAISGANESNANL